MTTIFTNVFTMSYFYIITSASTTSHLITNSLMFCILQLKFCQFHKALLLFANYTILLYFLYVLYLLTLLFFHRLSFNHSSFQNSYHRTQRFLLENQSVLPYQDVNLLLYLFVVQYKSNLYQKC